MTKQKGIQYHRTSIIDSLNILESDFNSIEMELRITIIDFNAQNKNSKLLRIIKNRSGAWNGTEYNYYYFNKDNYNFNDVDVKHILFNTDWDRIWSEILDNNYLNLITESEIRNEHRPLIFIGDGIDYTIEVFTKDRYRYISYSNPQIKEKDCIDTNKYCPEISDFNKFIDLLRKEFHFGNTSD